MKKFIKINFDDFIEILEKTGYFNLPLYKKKELLDIFVFTLANNSDYLDNETTICKSPEENYNDWLVYEAKAA